MDSTTPQPPEDEVLFLTLHHLHSYDSTPEVASALHSLETALAHIKKLPTSIDYTGSHHSLTYAQCAQRYNHIPSAYLRDLLSTRLPNASLPPSTLLAKGRYSTAIQKRPRRLHIAPIKNRLRPLSSNVATLVDQQAFLNVPMPYNRATFALLPKTFRRLKTLVGHHLPVFTTLFDHSSRFIISGSDDHLIKIWSTETGFLQHTLRGHDGNITEIVNHPTRPIMVSASSDTTLRVWHCGTGAALHVLDGGSKDVNVVHFSPCPDRPYLVSGGADGSVRLWNSDNFEAGFVRLPIPSRFISRHATDTRQAGSAAASSHVSPTSPRPDPQPIAASSNHPHSADPARQHAANSTVSATPTYEVLSVCFNSGATRLAVSGTDCMAHVYAIDVSDGDNSPFPQIRLLTSLKGHMAHIMQVLFSRSGDSLVTGCRDGTARIWKRTKARLPGARGTKQSVAGMGSWSFETLDCRSQIQADARSVLSGAASGSACGSIIPRFRRPSFPVSVCAAMWSTDDKYLFIASSDTKIRVWEGETGRLVRILEAHESEVYVMDCHPTDERILLSAGYDGKCILWDIKTGRQLRSFSILEGMDTPYDGSSKIPRIADGQFSSNGLSFVVADFTGAIHIFGVGSGEAMALAPEEQFFSHDCAPFRRDEQHRAIDENTGVLLHLVPNGRLCDKELRPHPPELQPNLPHAVRKLSCSSGKEGKEDIETSSTAPGSPNYVQNKNRDALLQRAKEFRENQEKEERRLLREARNARRRLIMEREKVAFARENGQRCLPLRDFEVPDSDYEESDDDFDAEEYSTGDDSVASSSEDEEEIQPARRRKGKRKTVRESDDDPVTDRLQQPKRRSARRRRVRKVPDVNAASDESGESDGAGDESAGFEVGSQDSDSENSEASTEKVDGRNLSHPNPSANGAEHAVRVDKRNDVDGSADRALCGEEVRLSERTGSPVFPWQIPASPALKLTGALRQYRRRMKFNVTTTKSRRPSPAHTEASIPVLTDAVESKTLIVENRLGQSNNFGAHSVGSYVGRGHPSDGGGITGMHTPMNPSFTSERKDGARLSTFRPTEEHQGDTASCFRPRRMIEESNSRIRPSNQEQPRTQSGAQDLSPETQKALTQHVESDRPEVNKLVALRKASARGDVLEKSLLSDSPGRVTRKRLRSRTRNGARKGDSDMLDKGGPVVDIDELAERELEILDAKRNKRHHRTRRMRVSPGESDDVVSSDDDARQHSKRRAVADDVDTQRGQRQRKTRETGGIMGHKNSDDGEGDSRTLQSSEWLRSSSNNYLYVPQLGDDVMYFPAGHVAAMSVSRSMGVDPLLDKTQYRKTGKEVLDGTTFGKDDFATPLRFHVIDMAYEFPIPLTANKLRSMASRGKVGRALSERKVETAKTKIVLTLRLISGMALRAGQGDRFVLSYFPVDAPEYLVLTGRVEAALSRCWKVADRFRILFLNERRAWQYYTGTVRKVKPTVRSVMWNTVEVEYDNESDVDKGSLDLVSPWELEAHDILQGSKESAQQVHITRFSTVEPGLFPIIARELEAIRQVESNWRSQLSWLDTVETLASYSRFCDIVPCPLDLNTVLVRLCTGYYRHFCSFLHDISVLKGNAVRYHGPQSEQSMLAINVFTRIADTSERIRVHYLASLVPVHPINHTQQRYSTSVAQPTSRIIRPRPTNGEATGALNSGCAGRQFPVPLKPRQPSAFTPAPGYHDGATQMGLSQPPRMWNGVRMYPSNPHHHVLYPNSALGVALPPAPPGLSNTGASVRNAGRSTRNARSQTPRQNYSQGNRGNAASLNRGHAPPNMPLTTTLALGVTQGMASPCLPPYVNPGFAHESHVRMVANSNSTNNGAKGLVQKPVSTGISPQTARPANKLNLLSTGITPVNITPAPTNEATTTAWTDGVNNTNAGVQDCGLRGQAGFPFSPTMAQLLNRAQPLANRAGSTAGDGGAHSWGRSMEGAGGFYALQASTSDSHLPAPVQGRAQSPISPSTPRGEAITNLRGRQQGVSGTGNAVAPYHEHSTISIAAASTMSCGGADVAQQTATAESVDVAVEHP